MKRVLIGLSSLLSVIACSGTDVPVGAAGGGAAGASPTNSREEAASYASTEIPCSADSDCCVVVDRCMATGYLVAAPDRDTVRQLLDGASMDPCVGCISPSVEVQCEQSRCVAKIIESSSAPDESRQDHCGSLEVTSPTTPVGSEFGCGAMTR